MSSTPDEPHSPQRMPPRPGHRVLAEDGRRLRADAVRNHARLLDAAAAIVREHGLKHRPPWKRWPPRQVSARAPFLAVRTLRGLVAGPARSIPRTASGPPTSAAWTRHTAGTRPSSGFARSGSPYGALPGKWSCRWPPKPSPDERYRRAPRRAYHERVSESCSHWPHRKRTRKLLGHALLGLSGARPALASGRHSAAYRCIGWKAALNSSPPHRAGHTVLARQRRSQQQDEVGQSRAQLLPHRRAVGGGAHVVALAAQVLEQHRAHRRVVVHPPGGLPSPSSAGLCRRVALCGTRRIHDGNRAATARHGAITAALESLLVPGCAAPPD